MSLSARPDDALRQAATTRKEKKTKGKKKEKKGGDAHVRISGRLAGDDVKTEV
jgi:hypothetical protein